MYVCMNECIFVPTEEQGCVLTHIGHFQPRGLHGLFGVTWHGEFRSISSRTSPLRAPGHHSNELVDLAYTALWRVPWEV